LNVTPLLKEALMESIDHDRLERLLDAVRHVDGEPVAGAEAVPIPVDRGRTRSVAWLVPRLLGALALLAVGAVHLQQYVTLYSAIPTIGTLFILNFAAATVIALGLLAPLETVLGPRWGGRAIGLLALGGIALAATSFVFLAISEKTPLFGFMEPGYDPPAILASRIAEVGTVLLLGAYAVGLFVARTARAW
jgi:hypothetical protein